MPVHVLIVDGDDSALEKLNSFLSGAKYEVTLASGYAEAMEKIACSDFDVAVSEIELDGGLGFGLLTEASRNRPRLRFVMTSASHSRDNVLDALKLGASGYLRKEITESEMRTAVEEAYAERDMTEKLDIRLGQHGWVELQMPSSENTMRRLDHFFRLMYVDEVSIETLEDIGLAFREVVKNAIEWGHKFDVKKKVTISHMLFQDEFVFKIQDHGEGYDISSILEGPGDLVEMENNRQQAGKRPGGLGITMVKGLVDRVVYNEKGNMIVLSRKITPSEEQLT